MIFSSRNYAIGMAHYQIAGGHKALGLMVGGYILLAATILGLIWHNVSPGALPMAMRGVSMFLLIVQSFGLLFFGGGRIANCIRMDTMNNMLESHRLMPVAASRVLLSYLFGTTSQLLALLIVNAVVLAGVENVAGMSFMQFVSSQMVLAFFAIFIWSFMAMGAFMVRQALPLMVFGFIFGGIGAAFLREVGILPAMSILLTPFFGETIFSPIGGVNFGDIYYIAIPGQLAFAGLFFVGACRRYRGSYLTTFNIGMGIALVGIWSLLSVISIWAWPKLIESFPFRGDQPHVPAQVIAAMVVGSILAVVPLHALAIWEGVQKLTFSRRWLVLGAVLAMVFMPVLAADATHFDVGALPRLMSAVVLALHVLTLFAVFRFTRGMSGLAAGVLVIVLFVGLWIGPLVAETVRWTLEAPNSREDLSVISTLSPLGMLMDAWQTSIGTPPMLPGLIFQGIVASAAWALGNRRLRVLAMANEPKLSKA